MTILYYYGSSVRNLEAGTLRSRSAGHEGAPEGADLARSPGVERAKVFECRPSRGAVTAGAVAAGAMLDLGHGILL